MGKIVNISHDTIVFDDGHSLYAYHDRDCCEDHWLQFDYVDIADVEGLEFDLNPDGSFFERVDGYGIRLMSTNGHAVSIPGYGSNNGYYSSNITLVLVRPDDTSLKWEVSECQQEEDR